MLATSCQDDVGPRGVDVDTQSRAATGLTLTQRLAAIRSAYIAMDQVTYRQHLLLVSREHSELDVPYLNTFLKTVLSDAAKAGIDGLEPLVIQAIDGIATHGSAAEIATMRSYVKSLAPKRKVRVAHPNSALLVPIDRVSTSVTVDIRADAARVIFDRMIANTIATNVGPYDLDAVLAGAQTLDDLCNLPVREGLDRGLVTSARQQQLDKFRIDMCGETGRPGGAAGGNVAGAFVNLAESACLDQPVSSSESYSYEDQLTDLSACLGTVFPEFEPGPGAGLSIAVESVSVFLPVAILAVSTYVTARTAAEAWVRGELEEAQTAAAAAHEAVAAFSEAKAEENAAHEQYLANEELVAQAQEIYEQNPTEENKESLEALKAALEASRAAYEAAAAAAKEKEAEASEKLAAANEETQQAQNATKQAKSDGEFRYSDECDQLMFGQFEGSQFYEDVHETLARHDPSKGPSDEESNWAPDSDHGVQPFGLVPCGTDPTTLDGPETGACSELTQCAAEDLHCACTTTPPEGAEAVAQGLGDMLCGMALGCEHPEMGPSGCRCGSEGASDEGGIPDLGPDVAGPGARFLDLTFANLATAKAVADLSMVERFTVGAVRGDTTPDEAFSDAFDGE